MLVSKTILGCKMHSFSCLTLMVVLSESNKWFLAWIWWWVDYHLPCLIRCHHFLAWPWWWSHHHQFFGMAPMEILWYQWPSFFGMALTVNYTFSYIYLTFSHFCSFPLISTHIWWPLSELFLSLNHILNSCLCKVPSYFWHGSDGSLTTINFLARLWWFIGSNIHAWLWWLIVLNLWWPIWLTGPQQIFSNALLGEILVRWYSQGLLCKLWNVDCRKTYYLVFPNHG